jgi:ribonucleoside-diphosphate reductase alpha chain
MRVQKRNGSVENVSFDKVLQRIRKAARGLSVNPDGLAQQVLSRIYDGVKTAELDELTSQLAASLATTHPDWATLAARIAISNHHKKTSASFSEVMLRLGSQVKPKTGEPMSYIHQKVLDVCKRDGSLVDSWIVHDRDYEFDYFGFKTLERAYLLKDVNMVVQERPQHLWMRVAIGLWPENLERARRTYDLLSQKKFTHATPTLFNAGTPREQLSSCFLLAMDDDSISGIFKTLGDCAAISKYAGGIGLHLHNIRAKGSAIKGTNGTSNGLVPMLRVFNNTARYVDQCFAPDTIIYTDKGAKAIEDVNVTDKVLTSNGTFENVHLPIRHEFDGEMLEIQVKNAVYPIRTTPEHQILALKGQGKGLNFDVIRNRLEKGLAQSEFHDAKDLVEGDFLVFPIPSYTLDISSITEDDCRFYGILLGDGHISSAASGVCLNRNTKAGVKEFVVQYLQARGVTVNEYVEGNTVRLKWSTASPGFKWTRSQLYDENKQKKIDTPFLHLPLEKVKQLLRGILETDGCVGSKEITLELSSYTLIESIRYLLLRLGSLCSGYERNRVGNLSKGGEIETKLPTVVLRIPRTKEILEMFPSAPEGEYFTYLRHGNYLFTRIQSITGVKYSGIVHDFEIDGPHDYVVGHMGVAHNGGGKRNGSFAMYLEPWHADVEDFLKLKLNTGAEEERARDLFYALWVPDLFMKRVEEDGEWSLFCPDEAPGLADCWGSKFEELYTKYEAEGRARKVVSAQKLWFQILDTQMETGTPYLLYKDAANGKSNQQNLGTIKSSNLCSEIIEYSDSKETAVCNLASLSLPAFVKEGCDCSSFNFEEMMDVVRVAVQNLNRVIDINYYPTAETERSNMRHRPIGLGVQGLADVFAMLKMSWESQEAADLNEAIFAHLYYAAVDESCRIAEVEGPYSTFAGSPASKGQLQFDLWGKLPKEAAGLDWASLKERVMSKGLRNSLLVAPMPTASTSQILGNNECFEPFTSNLYTRRTLAGEFIIVNKYLMKDLMDAGIWSENLKQLIVAHNGSVQGIDMIPQDIQDRYKTSWELKQRVLIDMAAARGAYIDQSQSLNLFVADPTYAKLTSMHFYAWKAGLKTGCYYLRTKAPVMAQKFTVDPRLLAAISGGGETAPVEEDEEDRLSESTEDKDSDMEDEASEANETPDERRRRERKELLDRLAKEFEEEKEKAKAAAESGEGCLMCGS